MNIPDHISESLETIFWFKNINSFMRIRIRDLLDPGTEYPGSEINIPDPQHCNCQCLGEMCKDDKTYKGTRHARIPYCLVLLCADPCQLGVKLGDLCLRHPQLILQRQVLLLQLTHVLRLPCRTTSRTCKLLNCSNNKDMYTEQHLHIYRNKKD